MHREIAEGEESEVLQYEADTGGKGGFLSSDSTESAQKAHHGHSYQESNRGIAYSFICKRIGWGIGCIMGKKVTM